MSEKLYPYLIKLSEGDESMITKIKYYDELNIIDRIVFNKKNPLNSLIKLEFNTDEFYNLFDYDSSDIDLIERVMGNNNYYYGYDFFDYHWGEEEWNGGYITDKITNSHDLIKEIVLNVDPTFKFGDEGDEEKIAKLLYDLNYRAVDNIIEEYVDLVNESCKEGYRKLIYQDTKNPFLNLNIFESEYSSTYYTTLGGIIDLFIEKNLEDSDNTLYEILQEYTKEISVEGSLYESQYELSFEYFDGEKFRENVKRYINDLLESSEEYFGNSPNVPELKKMVEIVSKMGGFDTWIDLPNKNKKINFKSIDKDTNTVKFLMTISPKNDRYDGSVSSMAEMRSVDSLEDLYTALNHPELFENLKKYIEKVLYS